MALYKLLSVLLLLLLLLLICRCSVCTVQNNNKLVGESYAFSQPVFINLIQEKFWEKALKEDKFLNKFSDK